MSAENSECQHERRRIPMRRIPMRAKSARWQNRSPSSSPTKSSCSASYAYGKTQAREQLISECGRRRCGAGNENRQGSETSTSALPRSATTKNWDFRVCSRSIARTTPNSITVVQELTKEIWSQIDCTGMCETAAAPRSPVSFPDEFAPLARALRLEHRRLEGPSVAHGG